MRGSLFFKQLEGNLPQILLFLRDVPEDLYAPNLI